MASYLTADTKIYRANGVPSTSPLIAAPVGATQQLYSGAVALTSGSGTVTAGYLKNASAPGSADLVSGMINNPAGYTYQLGPGILGGSTNGAVFANVEVGTFLIQSASGAGALSATTNFEKVYYTGENASGPIAASSSSGGIYPLLGIQFPQDPGFAAGFLPGSNYWPIKIGASSI